MRVYALGWAVFAFVGLAISSTAQQAPVPMDQEPHHHVVLKNEYVEVVRATLAPGESTGYHIHANDTAGVEFTEDTTSEQLLGEAESKPSPAHTGDVWAEPLPNGKPYTHRVRNIGTTTMDLIDVTFLQKPTQPPVAAAAPVAAENAEARIYKWVLAPGSTSAMHTHDRPYLIVAVTPMHLKMSAPDGRSLSEDVKPGDLHWVNARVTHSLSNEGATDGQIVEFELK